MKNSTIYDCTIVELPQVHDVAGNITAVENKKNIPFDIKRIYYLYDIPGGEDRGAHAHKKLEQFIIAASGSFDVTVNDGENKRTFILNHPNRALYLAPGIWRELSNFSSGAICLVLASEKYEENDYIRTYKDFVLWKSIDLAEFDQDFFRQSMIWLEDEELRSLIDLPAIDYKKSYSWFNSLSSRSDYKVWGIVLSGRKIGVCGIKNINGKEGEYFGYIGEKSYWGKGIGKLILERVFEKYIELDLKRAYLYVLENNIRAIKLYKKYGFIEIKKIGNKIKMEKKIK